MDLRDRNREVDDEQPGEEERVALAQARVRSMTVPSSHWPAVWKISSTDCTVSGSAAEAYTSKPYSYARDEFAARANVPVLSPSR